MKPSRWIAIAAGLAAVVVLFVVLRPGDDAEPSPTPTPTETDSPRPTQEPTETQSPSPTEEPTESPSPDGVEIEIEVEDGQVTELSALGARTTTADSVEVSQGDRVRLTVNADVSDEVHLHGYDLSADVTPDEPAVIVFRADAPGIYEVELESAGLTLLELSVVP